MYKKNLSELFTLRLLFKPIIIINIIYHTYNLSNVGGAEVIIIYLTGLLWGRCIIYYEKSKWSVKRSAEHKRKLVFFIQMIKRTSVSKCAFPCIIQNNNNELHSHPVLFRAFFFTMEFLLSYYFSFILNIVTRK